MTDKANKIKIEIIGSVYDGTKYLKGVVELPEDQAMSLIASKHAKPFDELAKSDSFESEPVKDTDSENDAESNNKKSARKNR